MTFRIERRILVTPFIGPDLGLLHPIGDRALHVVRIRDGSRFFFIRQPLECLLRSGHFSLAQWSCLLHYPLYLLAKLLGWQVTTNVLLLFRTATLRLILRKHVRM